MDRVSSFRLSFSMACAEHVSGREYVQGRVVRSLHNQSRQEVTPPFDTWHARCVSDMFIQEASARLPFGFGGPKNDK